MSQVELDAVYSILIRNPPVFAVIGGTILILIGGLLDTEILINSGWSSFITGLFLEIGWLLMMNARKR
jgi:hypothetical protein